MGRVTRTPRKYFGLNKNEGGINLNVKGGDPEHWEHGFEAVLRDAFLQNNDYQGRVSTRLNLVFTDEGEEYLLQSSSQVFIDSFINRCLGGVVVTRPFQVSCFKPEDKDFLYATIYQDANLVPYKWETKELKEMGDMKQNRVMLYESFGNWLSENLGLPGFIHRNEKGAGINRFGGTGESAEVEIIPESGEEIKVSNYTQEGFLDWLFTTKDPEGLDPRKLSFESDTEQATCIQTYDLYIEIWREGHLALERDKLGEWLAEGKTKYGGRNTKKAFERASSKLNELAATKDEIEDDLPF